MPRQQVTARKLCVAYLFRLQFKRLTNMFGYNAHCIDERVH